MAIASISNAEAGSSVRTKLNALITARNYETDATAAETASGAASAITDGRRDPGDIRRYGALADGSTNCAAAWAAAIAQGCYPFAHDAAPVYVPPDSGGWLINSPSTPAAIINGIPCRIIGAEPYYSGLYTTTDTTILEIRDVHQLQGVDIDGVGFSRSTSTGSTKAAIHVKNSSYCKFSRIKVINWFQGIRYQPTATAPTSCYSNQVIGSTFTGCSDHGILAEANTNNLLLYGVTVAGSNGKGVRVVDSGGFGWFGGNGEAIGGAYSLELDATVSDVRMAATVQGVHFEACNCSGGVIRLGNTALIRNVTIEACGFANCSGSNWIVNPERCRQLTVKGCSADTGMSSGFHINPNGADQADFDISNNTWQLGNQVIKGTLAFYDSNVALAGGTGWTGRHADALIGITYSASMTPNAALGNWQAIAISNTSAFTINNPTNPIVGQELLLWLANSAGAPHGTITWGSAFKMSGPLVVADTGNRHIAFRFNGTAWYETFRSQADVAN